MKLYFAGYSTRPEMFKNIPEAKNLLESYLVFKNRDYFQWHQDKVLLNKELFLDSGAFSANSKGVKIDIDRYIDFIKENQKYIKVYANLDVIGDYKKTQENQEYIEAKGLNPLPTFHYFSPLSELEKMIKKYDYIALGGLVPLSLQQERLKKWLDRCFNIIKVKVKVHGFGVNALWTWERYPFYSVDATSWLVGGKYRRLYKFKEGKFITTSKNDNNKKTIERYKTIESHYNEIDENNVKEFIKAKDFFTEVWKKRGIAWG